MKKAVTISLMMMGLSACNSAPMVNTMSPLNAPQATLRANASTPTQKLVSIVDRHTTVLNKPLVMQHLMNSEISVRKADIYDKVNVFRIEFSKSQQLMLGVPGFVRMYLAPSGQSVLQLVGNYYNNQPVSLSRSETEQLLKSAPNFPKGSELDRIFSQ